MKVCNTCGLSKPESAFGGSGWRTLATGERKLYRHAACSNCVTTAWRRRNPKAGAAIARRALDKRLQNLPALKAALRAHIGQTACRCGATKRLHFHHRDPSQKSFGIDWAIRRGYRMARLKTEAEKCDVRCATCHTLVHRVEAWSRLAIDSHTKLVELVQELAKRWRTR